MRIEVRVAFEVKIRVIIRVRVRFGFGLGLGLRLGLGSNEGTDMKVESDGVFSEREQGSKISMFFSNNFKLGVSCPQSSVQPILGSYEQIMVYKQNIVLFNRFY